jgi:hypothetical protein
VKEAHHFSKKAHNKKQLLSSGYASDALKASGAKQPGARFAGRKNVAGFVSLAQCHVVYDA